VLRSYELLTLIIRYFVKIVFGYFFSRIFFCLKDFIDRMRLNYTKPTKKKIV